MALQPRAVLQYGARICALSLLDLTKNEECHY
jgi:hypothetical protein